MKEKKMKLEIAITEKEKQEEVSYMLFYNMGELLLEINDKEKVEQTMTKTWFVYTCDEEGNHFFDYFAGRHDYDQSANLVFKYCGKEINNFVEILEPGQMVINGILIEKEEGLS